MTRKDAMSAKVETFYRKIFADLKVDQEESQELKDFLTKTNPPPDKNIWLRATAFRIGSEFISTNKDTNVALLRAINALVHAVESCRMEPKENENTGSFQEDKVTEFYKELYADVTIDREENQELFQFFQKDNAPPKDKLVYTRATAFRMAVDYLSTEDKSVNIQLLRCINVIVHAFEMTCLQPRPYKLVMDVPSGISINDVGVHASLSKAVQHMWNLDFNRLENGTDFVLNVQGGKKPYHSYDAASDPLFTRVNRREFSTRPTYRAFVALLDNYNAQVGVAEHVTAQERKENWTFLNAIYQTAPMQFCHKYCRANVPDRVPADKAGFLKLLHEIWFDLYRRTRGGRQDSSGFEHVFVGEIKDDKVTGFHNWIHLYLEEKRGNLDYRGYIKPRSRNAPSPDDTDYLLTLQFAWKGGVEKSVGTCFIGVSPEFEMAVYSTCFLLGEEDNKVELNTGEDVYELNIKCFTMARGKIGTSYPEALSHYET